MEKLEVQRQILLQETLGDAPMRRAALIKRSEHANAVVWLIEDVRTTKTSPVLGPRMGEEFGMILVLVLERLQSRLPSAVARL